MYLIHVDAALGSLRASRVIANSSCRLQSSQQVSVLGLIFVPTPHEGEELYSNGFFFVQTILADRFNNRREL